jgi:hypothetical protein
VAWFEAIDGINEADVADLDQVIEGLAGVSKPRCQRPDKALVATHKLFPDCRVAIGCVCDGPFIQLFDTRRRL